MVVKQLATKIVAVALTVSLSVLPVVPGTKASAASVSDITGNWAEKQITQWMDSGLISGYPDGTFQPNRPVTRAELVALINKSFGFTEEKEISFKDVDQSKWHYTELKKAAAAGYISGYADGTFGPDKKVSRQEFAVMVGKLLQLQGSGSANGFQDQGQMAAWGKEAIGAVLDNGIMSGYDGNKFLPNAPATRGEAVVILDRSLQLRGDKTAYNQPGTYGPKTGSRTVNHNVEVQAAGVTLQNMVINGNLLLGEGIGEGEAYLSNVTVTGTVIVSGGGANSVHIQNSKIGQVTVNKKSGNVRVIAEGTTNIREVALQSGAIIQTAGSAEVAAVNLLKELPQGARISLEGSFITVNVAAKKITLDIPGGQIQSLNVAKEAEGGTISLKAKIAELVLNAAAEIKGGGSVGSAIVNAPGVSFEQAPGKLAAGKDAASIKVKVGGQEQTVSSVPAQATVSPAVVVGGGGGGGGGAAPDPVSSEPAATPVPTATPEASPSASPAVPTPTPTPTPEASPSATPAPTPVPGKVSGKVVFQDGSSVLTGILRLRDMKDMSSTAKPYDVKVTNGLFNIDLRDSTYRVYQVMNETTGDITAYSDFVFEVTGGKVNPDPLVVKVNKVNVTGTVTFEDGTPVKNGRLEIVPLSKPDGVIPSQSFYVMDGKFNLSMPDGNYSIPALFDYDTQRTSRMDFNFSVNGGKSDPEALSIVIKEKRLTGTVVHENGTLVNSGKIEIWNKNNGAIRTVPIKAGRFDITLPYGTYTIDLFDSESQEYRYGVHTLTLTQETPPKLSVELVYKNHNVAGTLMYKDGTKPAEGQLKIRRTVTGATYAYNYAKVKDGAFSFYTEDGDYEIYEYSNGSFYRALSYKFSVANGKITQTKPLVIELRNSVRGVVQYEDGTRVGDGRVEIWSVSEATYRTVYLTNGEFKMDLPDGQYKVSSYYDYDLSTTTELTYTFTVEDSLTEPSPLVIQIHRNVSGTVYYEDGTPGKSGKLYIRQVVSDDVYKYTSAPVQNGEFSLRLTDGNYEVYGYSDEDASNSRNFSYNFKVIDGVTYPSSLQLVLKSNNVSGNIVYAGGDQELTGKLSLRNTVTGAVYWDNFGVKDGFFSFYLPDGSYQLFSYRGTESWPLSYAFTVTNGKSNPEKLQIFLKKLTGLILFENGTSLEENGTLNIRRSATSVTYDTYEYVPVIAGQFQVNLSEGDYEVVSYSPRNSASELIGLSFTIAQGEVYPDPLKIVLKNRNAL
ncbi:S-layer homology domain-containing protein [Paenibacillus sp. CN-4]|uniref:S-layer homology domain-containing protein n=1 Tax=Paenibacillus nanchangensis TaxID=3348343 RepID=UPI00397CEC2F